MAAHSPPRLLSFWAITHRFSHWVKHNNFNPEFHKYLRRAGIAIPTKRHTGVHTIRHSFATNMLRKGTPVQDVSQILGHSNISVTETYLRVDIEHMRLCSLSWRDYYETIYFHKPACANNMEISGISNKMRDIPPCIAAIICRNWTAFQRNSRMPPWWQKSLLTHGIY